MALRLGVDVGGTFTDVVVVADGAVRVAKVASTRDDQAGGILDGVARAEVDLAAVERFVHGTTVATNTVLERDGARLVLVTTAGFRDLLEIGRQDRPALYDLTADRPPPLVAGEQVVEVAERIGADGSVVLPLRDDEVARVAAAVDAAAPEAVVVSLLFSFLDDRHERRLAEALGDRHVSRSSAVLPVFREYERTSTTALNASVAPRMERYLGSLERRLGAAGLGCGIEVMRSGGGTFTADLAAQTPVHTLLSGPAAGAWGAAAVAGAAGHRDVLAFDMGGTSTDVTLIEGGRPRTTAQGAIGGLPFAIRTTDIHTIGAGGGSIAWLDAGGALRVGPRSAGADPGPACYGRGGSEPTVTDADVVLGHLPADAALGGHVALSADRAAAALQRLGEDAGLDLTATATGVLRVVEAQMVKALRVVSVEQGRDPRRLTLVPFGGAGPLHQGALARELGCRRVLVPPHAGVLSALGLLAAPVTADEVRTALTALADADPSELTAGWATLEDRARRTLERQGVPAHTVRRSADLRYRGQAFELEVAAGTDGAADEPADPAALEGRFHAAHRERYGYAQPGEPVELVNLRVRAEAPPPRLPLPAIAAGRGAAAARIGDTAATVDGGERPCPTYRRDRLGAGDRFDGPAVVVGVDTTVWVEPWQRVTVDPIGCLVLEER